MAGAITVAILRGEAVEVIDETAGNTERCVHGKEPGQAIWCLGINFFVGAGQSPGAADAIRRMRRSGHGFGRSVMQEAAESQATELLVVPSEQDELMPGIVYHLRWHGYHVAPGHAAELEIVAQPEKNLGPLSCVQFWPPCCQARIKVALVKITLDESGPSLPAPLSPEQKEEQRQRSDDDQLGHAPS